MVAGDVRIVIHKGVGNEKKQSERPKRGNMADSTVIALLGILSVWWYSRPFFLRSAYGMRSLIMWYTISIRRMMLSEFEELTS